jgi:membrane protein insertase Oxa1/YidC/SpoIIIJ
MVVAQPEIVLTIVVDAIIWKVPLSAIRKQEKMASVRNPAAGQ